MDMEESAFTSPVSSPVHSFPPLYGSFNLDTLPSVYRTPMHKVSSYGGISLPDDHTSRQRRLMHQRLGHSSSDVGSGVHAKNADGECESSGGGGGGGNSPVHSKALGRSLSRRSRKFALSLRESTPRNPSLLRLQFDKSASLQNKKSPTVPQRERPKSTADALQREHKSPR